MHRFLYILLWPILRVVMPRTKRARVLIVRDEKVLVVKNRIGLGYWHLVGGGVKRGESVLDAARREVCEELRVELIDCVLLSTEKAKKVVQGGIPFQLFFVQATLSSDAQIRPNHEIAAYKWIRFSEVDDKCVPEVHQGLSLSQTLKKC